MPGKLGNAGRRKSGSCPLTTLGNTDKEKLKGNKMYS